MRFANTHSKTTAGSLALTVALAAPGAAQAMASQAQGKHGGLSWLDLAIALGILAAIILAGLWGDLVLGAAIVAVWTLFELSTRLVVTGLRATRSSLAQARFRALYCGSRAALRNRELGDSAGAQHVRGHGWIRSEGR
jgi:hypothetical protein